MKALSNGLKYLLSIFSVLVTGAVGIVLYWAYRASVICLKTAPVVVPAYLIYIFLDKTGFMEIILKHLSAL